MEDEVLTGFESLIEEPTPSAVEQGFADLYKAQQGYFSEQKKALNTTTLLTALARTDPTKNISHQITADTLQAARETLELGQERQIRHDLVRKRMEGQLKGLGEVVRGLNYAADPELVKGAQAAYDNVLQWDTETKAKTAIEEAAIERIQTMAASDPVQAKVLLDNLEFGDAEETIRQFNVKLSLLRQKAEEYDEKYQESGWGRYAINTILNLFPVNYNFARTGIVGDASVGDLFTVGSAGRKQSENLWNLPLEEFADFVTGDGLDAAMDENATSLFEIDDPGARVQIMDDLITLGDSRETWNNIWGGVEIASAVPWTKLSSASRTLVTSGAAKDAVRNLDNAAQVLEARGPEAMTKMTGVTEKEIVDELSVSAIKGTDDYVPLSEPVAAHREAAQIAAKEIFNSPEMQNFRSMEELQDWITGRVDEIRASIGSPIKDVHMKPVELPGGRNVHQMVFTVGKKDGFGYASEAAAKRGLRSTGFAGEAFQESVTRVVDPKKGKNLRVYHGTTQNVNGNLRSSTNGSMGQGLYTALKSDAASNYARGSDGGRVYPLNIDDSKIIGLDKMKGYTVVEAESLIDELGLSLDEFTEWKKGQNIEDLKLEVGDNGLIDSENVWNDLTNFVRAKLRKEADEGGEFEMQPEEYINDLIKAKGYTGRAMPVYGEEVVLVFNAEDAVSSFAQSEVIRDMSGQYFNKITVDMPEAGWLTGKLEPDQLGFVGKMVGRWFLPAGRLSDTILHGTAIESGSYLNRAGKHIDAEVMGVFRQLPKESKEVVRSVAHAGAKKERNYSPEEVDFLVDRGWGRKATDAEQRAYADLKMFNDMDWELRNAAMYLDKVQRGHETVTFKTKWGQAFDDVDVKVDRDLSVVPTERVYDASRGKHYVHGRNSLDQKTLTTMKNNGYVMMTFPNGFTLPEGIVTNKVLIKKVDVQVKPLKREQLAYSEGGHRMYTSRVFVKQGRKGTQSDTGTQYLSTPSTFRTAENIAEGRKWADKMNEARLAVKENRGITAQALEDDIFKNDPSFGTGQEFLDNVADDTYNLDNPFEAVFDRELPSMYNTSGEDISRLFDEDELGINGYYRTTGRMYTSSKGEILRDTKGNIAEILDPYDTLSRSLNQVTRQIGLFNYKMNAMERFAKTYKDWLQIDPNLRTPSQILTEGKVNNTASLEMRNQIEAQRAAILNVLRFETPAERVSRQAWQATAEKVLGDGDSTMRKIAHDAVWWWKDNDPVAALRGFAFDMKLGMFNIAQLFVQSTTMASAFALSPKFGGFGIAGLAPMHAYILKRGSENVLDTLTKRGVGKTMGFASDDEFKTYARHAYKHGFMEMNGSHIMINNYGPNAHFGSWGETQTRAREQARVFFYTAETWNRLVAYRIAWGEAAAKGLTPNSPEFNSTILKLADDYSFNMTSESAAYWQKGVLSIPTQFWAYNMRMMDAMFGKRFTWAQRRRLIGMNVAIAGTAGVPGVQALSEYIKQQTGSSPDPDTLAAMVDRGLIDYMNHAVTGNDVIIGERLGTGGWASDVVKSMFGKSEYGQQSFVDLLGGATYSIAKSTSKTLYNLGKYAVAEQGGADVGPITKDNLINVFKEVSTFSNISKAYLTHQYGMYKSNKGTVLASDIPSSQAAYALLSFRPAKADEIGYMLAWSKNKEESHKEFAKQLRNWRQEALVTGDYEKYWTKANTLMQLIPVQDRRQIIKGANSMDDKSFYDYLENKVSEEQAEEEVMEGLE